MSSQASPYLWHVCLIKIERKVATRAVCGHDSKDGTVIAISLTRHCRVPTNKYSELCLISLGRMMQDMKIETCEAGYFGCEY